MEAWKILVYLRMFQSIGWSSVGMDNLGIFTDVLVYRLVQWRHGQSWDIYGCSSLWAGPVEAWTILGYLRMF